MRSFLQFINEDFKTTASKFVSSGADTTEVNDFINRFRILNKNQRLSGEQKNIDFWGKGTFSEFKDFVASIENIKTKSASKKDTGTFLTIPNSKWNIIIPTDKSASCFHGSRTWCTTKASQEHFENYFYDRNIILVYLINKETKEKFAMALHKDHKNEQEFFNSKYTSISKQQLSNETSIDVDKLIAQVLKLNPEIETQRETSKKLNLSFTIKNLKHPDKEIEQKIINSGNAKYAYDYAFNVLNGPFKAGEAAIAKDTAYAYDYAYRVLNGPFKAGEAAIATDAVYAYSYAVDVLEGRFKAGEAAIATDALYAYDYALHVLKGRFQAGEETIAKGPGGAYLYARNVIKGPFQAGEAAIATVALYAYSYALYVLRGPFQAGEAAIATDAAYAYDYALSALKGRFQTGEAAMAKDPYYAYEYALTVLKGRFPAGEAAMVTAPSYAYEYALNVLKGPFQAGEAVIAKNSHYAYKYAKDVLKGPFILNGKTIVE